MRFAGVSDCRMQEGSLRADINLSVRPEGEIELGTRTEMKNLNSFRAAERAIKSESARRSAGLDFAEILRQKQNTAYDTQKKRKGYEG